MGLFCQMAPLTIEPSGRWSKCVSSLPRHLRRNTWPKRFAVNAINAVIAAGIISISLSIVAWGLAGTKIWEHWDIVVTLFFGGLLLTVPLTIIWTLVELLSHLIKGALGTHPPGVCLRGADLRGQEFVQANLAYSDLREADLRGALLDGADLQDADLRGADLRDASLREANLAGADFRGANIEGIILSGAVLPNGTHHPA